MKKHKIAATLILLVGVGVMAFAGAQLLEAQKIYREGNAAYDDLGSIVKNPYATKALSSKEPQVYIPQLDIDFEALKAVNKDAVAWLYCPDTVIDYPVMHADNYTYYLDHLPDGTWNANGSLFIDYNNASDFSEPLTVVYGHHMKSGRMFGSLVGYKDQDYYDQYPFMYLYTENGNYQVKLIYGCVIGAGQWRERAFMYSENVKALLAYAAYNTTFESGIMGYKAGERVIALSTCSYEFDNARYVVIGILVDEYEKP